MGLILPIIKICFIIHLQVNVLLHYIGYLIVGKQFNYHITDICKTPMDSYLGGKIRKDLYSYHNSKNPSWYSLIEKEFEILNNPRIICLGKSTGRLLQDKLNLTNTESLYHYNKRVFNRYILKEYHKLTNGDDIEISTTLYINLKNFAEQLFNRICEDKIKVQRKLNSLFQDKKIDYRLHKIYAVYQNQLKFDNE